MKIAAIGRTIHIHQCKTHAWCCSLNLRLFFIKSTITDISSRRQRGSDVKSQRSEAGYSYSEVCHSTDWACCWEMIASSIASTRAETHTWSNRYLLHIDLFRISNATFLLQLHVCRSFTNAYSMHAPTETVGMYIYFGVASLRVIQHK